MQICLICNSHFATKRALASHIQHAHKMKSREYVIDYMHNGIRPLCIVCKQETRYSGMSFKRFCTAHAKEAMREGGKHGGQAEAWNKGLSKTVDTRIAQYAKKLEGKNNPFYGKRHTNESKLKIKLNKLVTVDEYEKRIDARLDEFELLTIYDEYFSRQQQYLKLRCKQCNSILEKTLQAFERGSTCEICFPNNSSIAEREIYSFINSLINSEQILANTRAIISPKELDIYVSSKRVAIEYNGLYWHSRDDNDKNAHKIKTQLCINNNIRLIQFFSDEWHLKRNICESIIRHTLSLTINKVYARNCNVIEIRNRNIIKDFFEKNHIDGYSQSIIAFALIHNNNIVSMLSLRKAHHKMFENAIEICRFANSVNTHIPGGFSKLLKAVKTWCVNNNITKIVTYADLRFSVGNVYKVNGFNFVRDTGLNYWYTDGQIRFNRFKFRARNGKSEKQIALENKVSRIYGCGNYLFEMDIL